MPPSFLPPNLCLPPGSTLLPMASFGRSGSGAPPSLLAWSCKAPQPPVTASFFSQPRSRTSCIALSTPRDALRSTFALRFSSAIDALCSAVNKGGRSSTGLPKGATMDSTVCFAHLEWRSGVTVMTSPSIREELGSLTRKLWFVKKLCPSNQPVSRKRYLRSCTTMITFRSNSLSVGACSIVVSAAAP